MKIAGLVLRRHVPAWAIIGASILSFFLPALSPSATMGQQRASAQQAARAGQTTVRKPVLPEVRSAVPSGTTYVAAEAVLDRVRQGVEPRSLEELQAMELQQQRVAAKINAVTVNVQQGSAQGSGVIITPDGFVLTAAHVAGKPGREASVILADGRRVRARTLGMNRTMDAGLLQIVQKGNPSWPYATLGRSDDLRLGEWVIAAGHPGGWMSDRAAVIRIGRVLNLLPSTLVTDCALIGGDSGGPLFDLNGQLVGIHSRIGTETADNMHVPIDVFRDSWDRLAAGEAWGSLPGFKPVIGVVGYPQGQGDGRAEIASIVEKSPAAKYGLKVGDVILVFDGRPIATFDDLRRAVSESLPGDLVEIQFEREGQVLRRSLIVGLEDP
jgi:serine protease Do